MGQWIGNVLTKDRFPQKLKFAANQSAANRQGGVSKRVKNGKLERNRKAQVSQEIKTQLGRGITL